jgi:hypothetical protein
MDAQEICVREEERNINLKKKRESESKKETINARVIVVVDVDLFLSSTKKERKKEEAIPVVNFISFFFKYLVPFTTPSVVVAPTGTSLQYRIYYIVLLLPLL